MLIELTADLYILLTRQVLQVIGRLSTHNRFRLALRGLRLEGDSLHLSFPSLLFQLFLLGLALLPDAGCSSVQFLKRRQASHSLLCQLLRLGTEVGFEHCLKFLLFLHLIRFDERSLLICNLYLIPVDKVLDFVW